MYDVEAERNISPSAKPLDLLANQGLKLTICSTFGDPLNPQTWSGTPFNICRILQNWGYLGTTINCQYFDNHIARKLAQTISYLYYQGSPGFQAHGKVMTAAKANYVAHQLAHQSSEHVLHFGDNHLPLRGSAGLKHYLFIDHTWNLTLRYSVLKQGRHPKLNQDVEAAFRQTLTQMTHVFSVSESLKAHLVSDYGVDPQQITVVNTGRGGIQPFFGPKDYANPRILSVARRMRDFQDRGGDILLEGFRLAQQQDSRLTLILAGHPFYQTKFANLPGVIPYGYVSLTTLQSLYNSATLFAMPARNQPWGIAYLEALSCQVPVLGLKRHALPEITQNGRFGFLLAEATPAACASALLQACADPEQLRQMAVAGQHYCLQNFTWENTVEKILAVLLGLQSSATVK